MQYRESVLNREEALKILRIEARPKYLQDWPVLLIMALYGVAAFMLGSNYLLIFLFATTCLAMAMHRHTKRQSELARAVLFLLDEVRNEQSKSDPAQQDEALKP